MDFAGMSFNSTPSSSSSSSSSQFDAFGQEPQSLQLPPQQDQKEEDESAAKDPWASSKLVDLDLTGKSSSSRRDSLSKANGGPSLNNLLGDTTPRRTSVVLPIPGQAPSNPSDDPFGAPALLPLSTTSSANGGSVSVASILNAQSSTPIVSTGSAISSMGNMGGGPSAPRVNPFVQGGFGLQQQQQAPINPFGNMGIRPQQATGMMPMGGGGYPMGGGGAMGGMGSSSMMMGQRGSISIPTAGMTQKSSLDNLDVFNTKK